MWWKCCEDIVVHVAFIESWKSGGAAAAALLAAQLFQEVVFRAQGSDKEWVSSFVSSFRWNFSFRNVAMLFLFYSRSAAAQSFQEVSEYCSF